MFFQFAKKLAAVAMAAVMVLSMAACSGEDSAAEEEPIDKKMAAQGGSITLPEGLAMPDTDATMLTDFSGGQMSGVFKTINSQQTKYFKQNGSVTITISGESSQEGTKYTDAYINLWKKGEGTTTYIETIHFTLDGTPYTYTFENLDPAAEYRIGITYNDVPRYKMTGSFVITGITAENNEDDAAASGSTEQA